MTPPVTRRSLIGGAAAGAGLAGLTAARELMKKGVKDVVVLEARNRVGGRTWTRRLSGVDYDVGGQWLKPEASQFGWAQERITALAKEVGVEIFKTYNEGDNLYYFDGTLQRYDSTGPFGPI